MSSTPIHQPGQIGPGNDMDMIKSYGGAGENQQSSTMEGGGLAVNTVPSDEVNKTRKLSQNRMHINRRNN